VKLGRDDIIALTPSGAFDRIASGLARPMQARALLMTAAASPHGKQASLGQASLKQASLQQASLFAAEPSPVYGSAGAVLAPPKKKTEPDELWQEYAALGFLRKVHPLALWKDAVLAARRIKAIDIGRYIGRFVTLVGWPVTPKEVWTKDGLAMSFLTFEDETAIYETVIFPPVYERYGKLLFDQRPLLVSGKVAAEWEAVSLEVEKVCQL
jgi:DNA polymerase-3 subunit alpha/error-prone DNA polymerase